jgi:hypothetical protein
MILKQEKKKKKGKKNEWHHQSWRKREKLL